MLNKAIIAGILEEDFKYSHTTAEECFYVSRIAVERQSGFQDHINIVISEYLLSPEFEEGSFVEISGSLRAIHKPFEDGKWHIYVYVFVASINVSITYEFVNQLTFSGYVLNSPSLKNTFTGRYVSDFLVSGKRGKNRFSVIPCIAWGSNAIYAQDLQLGDKVFMEGRLQSREFVKDAEVREVHELSVNTIW